MAECDFTAPPLNPPGRDDRAVVALHVVLLGVPMWWSTRGDSQSLSRKEALLVALLTLAGPQPRDALARRLWPDADQGQANASLHQRIARLRRDTGHLVIQTGTVLRLAEGVGFDVAGIGAMGSNELLTTGGLLAGFDYTDNADIGAWIRTQRDRVRRAFADALADHAQRHEARGELLAALHLNDRALALAPEHTNAWRRQARLHCLREDDGAAIQTSEPERQ